MINDKINDVRKLSKKIKIIYLSVGVFLFFCFFVLENRLLVCRKPFEWILYKKLEGV